MIHRIEEGGLLHYGLNVETVRDQGWAFVLFWRGLTHYYGLRMRIFRYWRRPRVSAWRGL